MTKESKISLTVQYLLLLIGAVALFIPFYWMAITSFKTGAIVLQLPPEWIPNPLTWEHYINAWNSESVWHRLV